MSELNWSLFEDVNGLAKHSSILDQVMVFAADKLIFLLPLLALLFWFALARWSPLIRDRSQADAAAMIGHITLVLTAVAVVLALGLNILLGHLIFEPRPFVSHPSLVHRLIPHAADASFPSDHTAVAFAIATVLVAAGLLLARRRTAGGLALCPLLAPLLAPFIRLLGRIGLA